MLHANKNLTWMTPSGLRVVERGATLIGRSNLTSSTLHHAARPGLLPLPTRPPPPCRRLHSSRDRDAPKYTTYTYTFLPGAPQIRVATTPVLHTTPIPHPSRNPDGCPKINSLAHRNAASVHDKPHKLHNDSTGCLCPHRCAFLCTGKGTILSGCPNPRSR
jgi:hypothetical protein